LIWFAGSFYSVSNAIINKENNEQSFGWIMDELFDIHRGNRVSNECWRSVVVADIPISCAVFA